MASNIRFRVHTRSDEQEEQYQNSQSEIVFYQTNDNPVDALLSLMSMVTMMSPVFNQIDPVQFAMQNSTEDQVLRRCTDVKVSVDTQLYNTTEKKFDNCSICTDKYEDAEMVSVLNCGHVYHPKCIKEWGHYNPSCPVCKAVIPTSRK
jgi:hypothetical protein